MGSWRLVEGELRVAAELEDDPEMDRSPFMNWIALFATESCVGMRDGGAFHPAKIM
jgi:hypothetical protein